MGGRDEADCARAGKALDAIRNSRRSQTAESLADAAAHLGYSILRNRGKGSHWWATQPGHPRFPIPTSRRPVSIGVTTRILTILEQVFDHVCTR